MSDVLAHLHHLYAETDDPWNFAHSPYEQAKFTATRDALCCDHYRAALEIGCGNGALAHHLAPLCDSYTGIDAVSRAVFAARDRVPNAHFIQTVYPCPLPTANYDLIILSEVLYFLTPDAIRQLACDLVDVAPGAELICVTYLGDTAQALQGRETVTLFQSGFPEGTILKPVADNGTYRIDRGEIPR